MAYNMITNKETQTIIDEDGNEKTTIKESTKKIDRSGEPDYIKLYTKVWCEFNQIPLQWRDLFFELITRMTYANSNDIDHSQLVATGGPTKDAICKTLGWKSSMYQKGLRALKDVGAIRQCQRGFYQINPQYAGRGEWKYNPKLERGGIEDLKVTFDFVNGTSDVSVVWGNDGSNSDINNSYRDGLQIGTDDPVILKQITSVPQKQDNPVFNNATDNIDELAEVM